MLIDILIDKSISKLGYQKISSGYFEIAYRKIISKEKENGDHTVTEKIVCIKESIIGSDVLLTSFINRRYLLTNTTIESLPASLDSKELFIFSFKVLNEKLVLSIGGLFDGFRK